MKSVRAILALCLALVPLRAQEDGPHVVWSGKEARVVSAREGRRVETPLRAPWKLALPGLPPLTLAPRAPEPPKAVLPAPERLAVVSDIHGNTPGFKALLQAHGVVDARLRWTYGKGHLAVLGDIPDRGFEVTEAFWLVRSLEAQARAAGGQVHYVLGNHDVMVMRGDLRYLHPKYVALKDVLGRDAQGWFGPDTELGRWLRTRPVALRLGTLLLVHGGLHPTLAGEHLDVEALNRAFRASLDAPGKPELLSSDGPVWYRGLIPATDAKRPTATTVEVERILKAAGASVLIVGHTTQPQVTAFHGGKVIAVDAGLLEYLPGNLLLVERGQFFRGLADGRREPLVEVSLPKASGH